MPGKYNRPRDVRVPERHCARPTDRQGRLRCLALSKVVTHGSLRIGFTHGHTIVPPGDGDSLLIAARQMDVDVLLWGGTHKFEAYEMEGKFFVNPGSATGAMTTGWWTEDEDPTPSFVLMDVSLPATCGHGGRAANQRHRCKATCLFCTCTSYGKTQKATRTSQWRRCHFGKTAVVYRRPRRRCSGFRRLSKERAKAKATRNEKRSTA
jgi:hypothetical protein